MAAENGQDVRPYRVYVESDKGVRLRRVWMGDARNTEHAARQAMKKNPQLRVDELVCIPGRHITKVPVRRNVEETITIG